ncbi:MAG: S1 family peptidase [Promethearchaeota archaeon]
MRVQESYVILDKKAKESYVEIEKKLNTNKTKIENTVTSIKELSKDLNTISVYTEDQAKLLDELTKQIEIYKRPDYKYLKNVTVIVFGKYLTENEPVDSEKPLNYKKDTRYWGGTGTVVKITEDYTYILTNKHVTGISEIKDKDKVLLQIKADKLTLPVPAEIVKIARFYDLALLKVTGKLYNKEAIKGIDFPEDAEKVYTIGHHASRAFLYGEGVYSCTDGLSTVFQLPCMWGCSGSGVFDKDGNLIGVVFSLKIVQIEGLGLVTDITHANAVPTLFIKQFLKGIIDE